VVAVVASSDWANPCGGERWRELGDGTIELEAEGLLLAPEEDKPLLAQTWRNWAAEMKAAAAETGVPEAIILAVATVETGLWSDEPEKQAAISSPEGAIGVMQIMPFNAKPYGLSSSDELYQPEKNILVGARILAHLAEGKAGDFVAAMAPYNSGSLCCPGRNKLNLCTDSVAGMDYGRLGIALHNSAIVDLGVGRTSSHWPFAVIAIGAVAAGWFYFRRRRNAA
jgi:hypothetical protein